MKPIKLKFYVYIFIIYLIFYNEVLVRKSRQKVINPRPKIMEIVNLSTAAPSNTPPVSYQCSISTAKAHKGLFYQAARMRGEECFSSVCMYIYIDFFGMLQSLKGFKVYTCEMRGIVRFVYRIIVEVI